MSAPKGIFKPEGWDYALSIKLMHDSPYDDGQPTATEGGGWHLSYHQEGQDPEFFTNVALRRCIRDRIPIGVLRKVNKSRRPSRYQVLGLALPVRWQNGYFLLEGLSPYSVWNSNFAEAILLKTEDGHLVAVEWTTSRGRSASAGICKDSDDRGRAGCPTDTASPEDRRRKG